MYQFCLAYIADSSTKLVVSLLYFAVPTSFALDQSILKMILRIFCIVSYLSLLTTALPWQDAIQDLPPRRQTQKSDHPLPGVKRVKTRTGPYKVPNMSKPSFPTGVHGMLWNRPDFNVGKPCDGTCTVLRQWAGLEYPNGTSANIDSGMW